MRMSRRSLLAMAVLATTVPWGAGRAFTEDFPSRSITLIVPFAAGGPTDTLARILAEGMKPVLGQAAIIENVTGASGSIAVGRVVHASPDGYTIGIGHWGTNVLNGAIYTLPYDLLADLTPVALIASGPQVIVGKKDLEAESLKGLIAWLKKSPGAASAGTAGAGSGAHVAGVFFQNMTDTQFQFIPYRGAGPAMADLMAGHIDLMFDQASNSLPQIRSRTIKAYAVTAPERLTSAPEIPTVDEAGLPGLYIAYWHAIWAPKNTPKDIVAKLNAAIVHALADPVLRKRFVELGQEIPPPDQQSPQALGAFQKAEIEKWWPIVKAGNIKAE